jgi:hypothetical protein
MRDLTFIASLILLVGLMYCVKNETTVASTAEPQIPTETLRSGDIIFRHGPSIESGVVMTMVRSNFSHAGIVLRLRDQTFVIHVVTGEGGTNVTKVESIHDYLRSDRATAAIAYRIVEENPSLIAHAVEAASTSIEITSEEITGEIADVAGVIKYKDGTGENFNQKLFKEKGDWKFQ